MKIADGFDARRLRPKTPSNWRSRLILTLAALLTLFGMLLLLAGITSLLGHPVAPSELDTSPTGASVTAVLGLLVGWLGIWLWRRRRRYMRQPLGLNMAPHLMKKRD